MKWRRRKVPIDSERTFTVTIRRDLDQKFTALFFAPGSAVYTAPSLPKLFVVMEGHMRGELAEHERPSPRLA